MIRLLLSYLDDPHAPRPGRDLWPARRDLQFIRQLLRKIGNQPAPVVQTNLHRLEEIPWLVDVVRFYEALAENEQPAAVHLVAEPSCRRRSAPEFLGGVAKRR